MIWLIFFLAFSQSDPCSEFIDPTDFSHSLDIPLVCENGEVIISTGSLFLTVITIDILIASLLYAYGIWQNDARYKVWAEDFIKEVIVAVVMFLAIPGFAALLRAAFGFNMDEIVDTLSELKEGMEKEFVAMNDLTTKSYLSVSQYIGYFWPWIGGFTFYPGAGRTVNAQISNMLFNILLPAYISVLTYYNLFLILGRFAFPVFAGFAIIFRPFPGLREAGNILIAAAFSLFIVLPFIFWWFYTHYNEAAVSTSYCNKLGNFVGDTSATLSSSCSNMIQEWKSECAYGVLDFCSKQEQQFGPYYASFLGLEEALKFLTFGAGQKLYVLVELPVQFPSPAKIAGYLLWGLFIPNVAMALYLSSTMTLMKVIKGIEL